MSATISVDSKTSNSVTLYLSGLDTSWTQGVRTVNWHLNAETKTTTLANGVSSGAYVTFNGLKSSTIYGVYCTIFHGDELIKELRGEVMTDEGEAKPIERWKWDDANGLATPTQVKKAYNAIVYKEVTTNFSWLVWDDLVDKVKELTDYTIGYWSETYASYSKTKLVGSASQNLTAVMFNSLRNNLELAGTKLGLSKIPDTTNHNDALEGTIPHPVEKGKTVFGHYFLTITDYINDCIDNLKEF